MSGESAFAPGSPLRGGVPVCFPWFGPRPDAALHGFARTVPWHLAQAREEGANVVLDLTLTEADIDREQARAWPHAFQARYTVTVGEELRLALEVTNTGPESIAYTEAFHTYLAVGDITTAAITGLEGEDFVDRLAGSEVCRAEGSPLRVAAETDRVYSQPGTIAVLDSAGARSSAVTATGSAQAVVWNPWKAKAAAMGDFEDSGWTSMICVETCNVLDPPVVLEPGASHLLTATLSVA
ncbi:MAG: D-hexose-6-phosphate mutarotase [Candidatus Nanopelagicales bacterium]